MKAERLAEAELIRARGNEEGQRRRAIADRQVVELQAEAQRDSEVLRGEGDAERNRVFAEAFSRDEDFFEFYRSMRAYNGALGGNGTTMVPFAGFRILPLFQRCFGPCCSRAERAGSRQQLIGTPCRIF